MHIHHLRWPQSSMYISDDGLKLYSKKTLMGAINMLQLNYQQSLQHPHPIQKNSTLCAIDQSVVVVESKMTSSLITFLSFSIFGRVKVVGSSNH